MARKKNPYQKYIDELDTMSDEELSLLEKRIVMKENKVKQFMQYLDSLNIEQLTKLKDAFNKCNEDYLCDYNYGFMNKIALRQKQKLLS